MSVPLRSIRQVLLATVIAASLAGCGHTLRRLPDVPRTDSRALSPVKTIFRLGGSVLALIGLVLLVMWLLGFVAFHVTSGVIHVLLVLALISIIVHFLRGRTVA